MRRIAVLMTCFNRVQTTLECLRRLFAQELPDGYAFDVWLVDDASPDGTGEKVKVTYPQVNVIQSPGNLFWCKGMRLAWDKAAEHADYDFYLWLNDDDVLLPDAVANAVKDFNSVAAVDGSVLIGAFAESENDRGITYSASDRFHKNIIPNGKTPQRAYDRFGGNFLFVPKIVADRIGKISGFYHHCYGDFDYAKRLEKARIPFYVMSKVVGYCSAQNKPVRPLRKMPLFRRLKLLWSPGSFHLGDAIVFRLKFFGVVRALCSMVHILYIVTFAKGQRRGL